MRTLKFEGLLLLLLGTSSFVLSACGNQGTYPVGPSAKSSAISLGVEGNAPPAVSTAGSGGSTSTSPGSGTSQPLTYNVSGMGNHSQYICVPAQSRLILRAMPMPNSQPIMPSTDGQTLINAKNGQLMYDGSPAAYSKLRVRLSIPGTSAAWDFIANVGQYSVPGDFSAYLRAVTPTQVQDTATLPQPEYDIGSQTIYGSSAYDGECTYWESQLHGCTLSSALRAAEAASCPAGQQKIMVTNVVSDYPCNVGDPTGWCRGGTIQTVPDYQYWNVQIQAMTENTSSFL